MTFIDVEKKLRITVLIRTRVAVKKMMYNADFNNSDAKLLLEKCLVSYVVHSPTPSYTWNIIAAYAVNTIFAITGTILNSLVLYIFWKSTKLRSKLSYFVIMLLSSADLAVVTIVHSTFLLQAINEVNGTPNCLYKISYMFSLYFFTGMSISTLLILNMERYTAIIYPIWHRKTSTKRRLMFIWAILWLINVANVLSRLFFRLLSEIITGTVICIFCCTSLFTYVSIFRVVRKRRGIAGCANCHGEVSRSTAATLREFKTAKTFFIIVVLTFVCFLPGGIVTGLDYPWNESEKERVAITSAFTWTNTLTSMNSTLNCLIFFWANKMLRREALKHVKNFSSTENS